MTRLTGLLSVTLHGRLDLEAPYSSLKAMGHHLGFWTLEHEGGDVDAVQPVSAWVIDGAAHE